MKNRKEQLKVEKWKKKINMRGGERGGGANWIFKWSFSTIETETL